MCYSAFVIAVHSNSYFCKPSGSVSVGMVLEGGFVRKNLWNPRNIKKDEDVKS